MKKNKNSLGITSLILFLIGIIILGWSFFLKYRDGSEYSGFYIIFGLFIGGVPFFASGTLALINICNYYSKNNIIKCNKFFLIFDWFVIAVIVLPYVLIQIYNLLMTIFY